MLSLVLGATLVWALVAKAVPALDPGRRPRRAASRAGRVLERARAARGRRDRARSLARHGAWRIARAVRVLGALLVYVATLALLLTLSRAGVVVGGGRGRAVARGRPGAGGERAPARRRGRAGGSRRRLGVHAAGAHGGRRDAFRSCRGRDRLRRARARRCRRRGERRRPRLSGVRSTPSTRRRVGRGLVALAAVARRRRRRGRVGVGRRRSLVRAATAPRS